MSKKMTQFRYYGINKSDEENTQASNLNKWPENALEEDNDWYELNLEDLAPIVYLGIQSIPGSRFCFNTLGLEPIIIGASGIYQLDLINSSAAIDKIYVDKNILNLIDENYSNSMLQYPAVHLIIDMVYEGEDDNQQDNIDDDDDDTPSQTGDVILYDKTGNHTDGAMTQAATTIALQNLLDNVNGKIDNINASIQDLNDSIDELSNDDINLYNTTGSNTDGAMTQAAVTEAINSLNTRINDIDTTIEYRLYGETGDNTDGAMTQAAVTEALDGLSDDIVDINNALITSHTYADDTLIIP